MDKEIKIKDFAECSFWACECPNCEEMIEVTDIPHKDDVIYCDQCGEDFKAK